jgi:hypothetical protein
MEIQIVFLAERIRRPADSRHDVQRAGVAFFKCWPHTPFPVCFTLPGLVLLRRENPGGAAPFPLRFDLIDQDGRPAGEPRRALVQDVFPPGPRFFTLMGEIELEFPAPGRYRLDISVDAGLACSVYPYDLDILPRQGP